MAKYKFERVPPSVLLRLQKLIAEQEDIFEAYPQLRNRAVIINRKKNTVTIITAPSGPEKPQPPDNRTVKSEKRFRKLNIEGGD